MKLLVLSCLVSATAAAPTPDGAVDTQTQYYEYIKTPNGFRYAYKLSDDTKIEAQGELVNEGKEAFLTIKGSFEYFGPNGVLYAVTYIADRNGYQPKIMETTFGIENRFGSFPGNIYQSLLGGGGSFEYYEKDERQ